MYRLARYIGHRGVAALAPENTLAGVRMAAAHGFRWIEIDARAAKDGIAVLSHDDSLKRCGGDARRISRMTAAAARRIPVACGMKDFADETPPLLRDALSLARALSLGVVAEIKSGKGEEEKAARAVCAELRAYNGAFMLSSFSMETLRHCRRLLPRAPLAYNLMRPRKDMRALRALRIANCHINARAFDAPAIARLKAAGYGVYCFTVNAPRRAQELITQGADGVFTDHPPAKT